MDKYSSPVSYFWGAICTLFGALSLNDIAVVVGIILSIATFIINWLYKRRDFYHKKNLREQYYEKNKKNSDRYDL
ncbi:phage holin family protein [Gilliamella sp. B2776]|uniref:phage holin family protein n=1 Tax=unclassified Gilliamella TaxID=2685620 RepID=UPI0027A5B6B9|nr:phage holin family protein [Gilliamella sp. B2779]MCX8653547.1 phage holin family protein [Gilliamella sp. B2737]MCX8656526.1 phage holin family protein [Gilliamella sp. B2894]MCX8665967.1 phage holin family protein [Gilliamella sp. B2887]MCX8692771.1 phage holin family protein [Gilliamella sp. B2776]MCX8693163.1 phage holin family protein [Gilliamella sp. B2881]MCX8696547.1 phage holin family protein [Gilliamella sp. B2828]MCX8698291.1 phage holin family protein [Gilliamella sp. B3000]M